MKILMIISSLTRGGSERRLLELIKGLKKADDSIDIYLISLFNIVDYTHVYELPIKFTILDKKKNKDFKLIFKLREIIRSYNPDVIHAWDFSSSIHVTLAKVFLKKILINGFIASAPNYLNILDRGFLTVKLLSPFSNAIISNSEAGLIAYKIPTSKGYCIYNGVDFSRFEKLASTKELEYSLFGEPKGEKFISVMVAAFEQRKDYKTMLEAAIRYSNANSNAVFLFIGAGADFDSIKEATPIHIVDKQIFFLGRRNDVESILQICDIGILITNNYVHGEGISNAIIEYMASGLPVIATRGGGTDEIVNNGVNGFLVDPKSPDQIIDKLQFLMTEKELRKKMGDNGFKQVRNKFELKTKTTEYLTLYKELLNKHVIV